MAIIHATDTYKGHNTGKRSYIFIENLTTVVNLQKRMIVASASSARKLIKHASSDELHMLKDVGHTPRSCKKQNSDSTPNAVLNNVSGQHKEQVHCHCHYAGKFSNEIKTYW